MEVTQAGKQAIETLNAGEKIVEALEMGRDDHTLMATDPANYFCIMGLSISNTTKFYSSSSIASLSSSSSASPATTSNSCS